MAINAKCNDCNEPTKYVVGFSMARMESTVAFMIATTRNAQ